MLFDVVRVCFFLRVDEVEDFYEYAPPTQNISFFLYRCGVFLRHIGFCCRAQAEGTDGYQARSETA
jgi:hypothetical protein